MPTIYHRNFRKLLRLIPNLAGLHSGHYLRFEAGEAFSVGFRLVREKLADQ